MRNEVFWGFSLDLVGSRSLLFLSLQIASTPRRIPQWKQLVFLFAVFVLCALAYVWARSWEIPLLRAPDGKYVLGDPDSYLRWRLVDRALGGEGVRIRWIPDDNAPFGHLNPDFPDSLHKSMLVTYN